MKKITIDGKNYTLNEAAALAEGLLIEDYPLQPGDVYVSSTDNCNNLLLVMAIYPTGIPIRNSRVYNLIGMGLAPNSNAFYQSLHTLDEIEKHLTENNMHFSRCIARDMHGLVGKCK